MKIVLWDGSEIDVSKLAEAMERLGVAFHELEDAIRKAMGIPNVETLADSFKSRKSSIKDKTHYLPSRIAYLYKTPYIPRIKQYQYRKQ